ncbi:MAG: hypothetical protein V3W41_09265 [Planctomycetota bacterium]
MRSQRSNGERRRGYLPDGTPLRKQNNIVIHPLRLIGGGLRIGYMRGLGDHFTLSARGQYITPLWLSRPIHRIGVQLGGSLWTRRANNGFFAMGTAELQHFASSASIAPTATTLAPGVESGYRWLWDSGFNIGFAASLRYAMIVQGQGEACEAVEQCIGYYRDGLLPSLVFDLGFAF